MQHPSTSSNIGNKSQLDEQQQALLALQQLGGLGWPVQSLLQNVGHGQGRQQMDILKQYLKTQPQQHQPSGINYSGEQQRIERELSHKRPSLIHDFGGNSSQQATHYSLIQPHLQQMQINQSSSGFVSTSEASYLSAEEEKYKRALNERLEKIDRERSQAAAMQKNAEKKAKACEKLLTKANQGPSFMAAMGDNEDNEEDRDGLSPTEAMIERIYAENRRKAAAAAPFPTDPNQPVSSQQLMAEDAARLAAEYEQGMQLLPVLVQAMRIQRERRQDALESRRIIYEEQLISWERKVVAYEKSQKKLTRDIKHRELFERTFVELKKMREEKERNSRVERARFSLTQGGNGIGLVQPSIGVEAQLEVEEPKEEDLMGELKLEPQQQEVDERAYAAAIVPPVFSNPARRYFDNRNGFVENSLSESRAQLEIFQNAWADSEKSLFNEKIAIYGKNFAAIAAFIPRKSVKECIQFYYMTKKRVNYKHKFGRRRKKIGRQGYRPPIMPRFGDTSENIQNYGKGCAFVQCLLCDSQILVLESLGQQVDQQAQHFEDFGQSLQQSYQQEMPICTKCQVQAQRNKTLNRCPLGSCVCVSGKRKMKPARNIPEKFATLGADQKRFVIYRLRMPPSVSKCCTNCFKRICKEIEDLLLGELQSEFELFKSKTAIRKQQSRAVLQELEEEEEEEEEDDATEPKPFGLEQILSGFGVMEGQPPLKELDFGEKRVEVKQELEEKEQQPCLLPRVGSITKGTPNRTRNTLLSSINDHQFDQMPPKLPVMATPLLGSEAGLINGRTLEELTSDLLAQLGPKEMTRELSRQLSGMLGSLSPEWLSNLQGQVQAQEQRTGTVEGGAPSDLGATAAGGQARRNSECLRRKTGLATAVLPSPVPEPSASNANPSARLQSQTTISPAISFRPGDPASLDNEKPLLEQRDSNMTANSSETTVPKTESNQGQLSSCYESLSEDSDEEKNTQGKTGRGGQEAGTANSSGQPHAPPALPAFFTVFDFQDEDSPPQAQSTTFASSSPSSARNQCQPTIPSFARMPSSRKKEDEPRKGDRDEQQGHPIYEPLSSDEEG